ncbi:hypothetical protein ZHAS_00006834 [Anopheles sinensis]|uniref:Uncharacterized protein n=1 Tax=Anopheles sinensis TaxID=74873 RepID=A0A084VN65_ANOSI|nr:hypothetical protein ZHAS_00006834 [Anopheles sinensis]
MAPGAFRESAKKAYHLPTTKQQTPFSKENERKWFILNSHLDPFPALEFGRAKKVATLHGAESVGHRDPGTIGLLGRDLLRNPLGERFIGTGPGARCGPRIATKSHMLT